MIKESKVETHFCRRVKEFSGEVRKVKWLGRSHAPDRFAMFPWGRCYWVELKRPGKEARDGQRREHDRLLRCGQRVAVLDSIEAVDEWIDLVSRLEI